MTTEPASLEEFIDESLVLSLGKKYPATRFREMRRDLGTKEAIRRLAESDVLQSGLRELKKIGLLEWSVEAAVLKFPNEFPSRLTRESARFKLDLVKRQG